VVAAARAVEHVDGPAGERLLEERPDRVGGHRHDANEDARSTAGKAGARREIRAAPP